MSEPARVRIRIRSVAAPAGDDPRAWAARVAGAIAEEAALRGQAVDRQTLADALAGVEAAGGDRR